MPTNPYELVFIVDAGADESEVQRLTDETKRIIQEADGEITKESNWGTRRLSFEIKKKTDGVYINMEFKAPETVPDQLRVFYKTQLSLLRHMILKIPKAKILQEKIDAARKEKELREIEKKRQEELAAQKAAAEAAAQKAAAEAEAAAKEEASTDSETQDASSTETPPAETSGEPVEKTPSETSEETPQDEKPAQTTGSETGE